MPIFEYECARCEHRFEKLVFGSGTTITCPECGAGEVEKVPSVFGFASKGAGGSRQFTGSTGSSACASCSSGNCKSCH